MCCVVVSQYFDNLYIFQPCIPDHPNTNVTPDLRNKTVAEMWMKHVLSEEHSQVHYHLSSCYVDRINRHTIYSALH